jgi:hypothetical protein
MEDARANMEDAPAPSPRGETGSFAEKMDAAAQGAQPL